MRKKLWNIGILHSSNQDYIFGYIWLCSFESSSHNQNALDGSHTEVVVVLLRQLLA